MEKTPASESLRSVASPADSPSDFEYLLPVFQALSSELRVEIMNLILKKEGINLKQIAAALGISVSTLSPHISQLHDCGLIRIEDIPASRGTQKCCYSSMTQFLIDFKLHNSIYKTLHEEIPIGAYTDFQVTATCGLATSDSFVGLVDKASAFTLLDRFQAGIIWLTTGYLEYLLPNAIPSGNRVTQLSFTFEISSEAPKWNNDWPSDIEFYLNGIHLGTWTCPGDFGDRPGSLNPPWWLDILNQYGLLKKLYINHEGTWIDDQYLSSVTIDDLQLTDQSIMKLRFQVSPDSAHPGGLTLYGKGFGDHNQNIRMSIELCEEQ